MARKSTPQTARVRASSVRKEWCRASSSWLGCESARVGAQDRGANAATAAEALFWSTVLQTGRTVLVNTKRKALVWDEPWF
jgi:hypothetical protein